MKTLTFVFILITATLAVNAQSWTKIGNDIDGESADDRSGYSVCLSADGSVVAIGAYYNDGTGANAGHVRVYENKAGSWTQIGNDIDGEAAGDNSGCSVSLNSDGSVLAIGAERNGGSGYESGHVRVYENNAGVWTQIGSDIDGEDVGEHSGCSVSLSSNGSVLAIGAKWNGGNGVSAGHVRVYENNAGVWTQIGDDIDGEAAGDLSGYSVSLSSDGSVVAIGAIGNDETGNYAGQVRIYENIADTWTQIGSDIDGEAADDWCGCAVSLNADGSIVAIGAKWNSGGGTNSGHVRVYENNTGTWTQIGNDINGEAAYDFSGSTVSLSSDGSIVAIGAPENDGSGIASGGHVRVYENNAGVWTQIGNDIDGENGIESGFSVSLSSDGTVVAIGAPKSDGGGIGSGLVRIYSSTVGIEENLSELNLNVFPNPVSDVIFIGFPLVGESQYRIIDTQGCEIMKGTLVFNSIDVSSFSPGMYILQIENNGKLYSGEFVKE